MNIERATATHGAGLKWSQVRRGEIWEHRVKKAATSPIIRAQRSGMGSRVK